LKVIQILPGSGGTFYCQNCMRDVALVKALRRQGQDVVLVPMYLPLYTDDPDITRGVPVFFGGINVYLQQHFKLFRKTPRWMDWLLDSRLMLWLAAQQEGSTKAAGMGEMTLSMLRGEDGNQAKEVERLISWLAESEKPDLVHISTSMLLGLAPRIKEVLKVPVVCSMQDEDVWIDNIDEPYPQKCWDAIAEKAAYCDQFVTVSQYYRDLMIDRLRLDPSAIEVVPIGIELDGYKESKHAGPPTIGYLSKLTRSLGLETLVEAFMILKRKEGLEDLQLRAMGGLVGADKKFVDGLRQTLNSAGMGSDVTFMTELDRADRIDFLKDLSVLSVPIPGGEAFGTFMAEAWAAGVPVVQPRAGAFPELVEATGGGVIYDGETPKALAAALEPLLRDPAHARSLGQAGRDSALQEFDVEKMATRMADIYKKVTNKEPLTI
jgi:glycosyltransferase involved in cell wall biosynthesis